MHRVVRPHGASLVSLPCFSGNGDTSRQLCATLQKLFLTSHTQGMAWFTFFRPHSICTFDTSSSVKVWEKCSYQKQTSLWLRHTWTWDLLEDGLNSVPSLSDLRIWLLVERLSAFLPLVFFLLSCWIPSYYVSKTILKTQAWLQNT